MLGLARRSTIELSSRVIYFCTAIELVLALLCPAKKAAADSFLRFKAGATASRTEATGTSRIALGGSLSITCCAPFSSFAVIPQRELLCARRLSRIIATEGIAGETYAMDFIELPFVLRGEATIGNRAFYAMTGGCGSLLL